MLVQNKWKSTSELNCRKNYQRSNEIDRFRRFRGAKAAVDDQSKRKTVKDIRRYSQEQWTENVDSQVELVLQANLSTNEFHSLLNRDPFVNVEFRDEVVHSLVEYLIMFHLSREKKSNGYEENKRKLRSFRSLHEDRWEVLLLSLEPFFQFVSIRFPWTKKSNWEKKKIIQKRKFTISFIFWWSWSFSCFKTTESSEIFL